MTLDDAAALDEWRRNNGEWWWSRWHRFEQSFIFIFRCICKRLQRIITDHHWPPLTGWSDDSVLNCWLVRAVENFVDDERGQHGTAMESRLRPSGWCTAVGPWLSTKRTTVFDSIDDTLTANTIYGRIDEFIDPSADCSLVVAVAFVAIFLPTKFKPSSQLFYPNSIRVQPSRSFMTAGFGVSLNRCNVVQNDRYCWFDVSDVSTGLKKNNFWWETSGRRHAHPLVKREILEMGCHCARHNGSITRGSHVYKWLLQKQTRQHRTRRQNTRRFSKLIFLFQYPLKQWGGGTLTVLTL